MNKNEAIIRSENNNGINFFFLCSFLDYEGIPILFAARDEHNSLYLCDCVELRGQQRWIISSTTIETLRQVISNKITVFDAIKYSTGDKIIASFNYETGNFKQDFLPFYKISPDDLPEEGAFLYYVPDDALTNLELINFILTEKNTENIMDSFVSHTKNNEVFSYSYYENESVILGNNTQQNNEDYYNEFNNQQIQFPTEITDYLFAA